MKKIFLSLSIIVLLSFSTKNYAQNADPLPATEYQKTEVILRAIVEDELKALRVKVVEMDSLKSKLTSVINELAGGKSYGRTAALSGTAIDTTKGSLFSYWFDASYYATCVSGDTVYASSDATFPATNRIALTAASPYLYTGKLLKSSIPNFYIKRKAGAATIVVQIYKRGN